MDKIFSHPLAGNQNHSKTMELEVNKALHIRLTPKEQSWNRNVSLELPGCWISTLKNLTGNHTHYHRSIR